MMIAIFWGRMVHRVRVVAGILFFLRCKQLKTTAENCLKKTHQAAQLFPFRLPCYVTFVVLKIAERYQ